MGAVSGSSRFTPSGFHLSVAPLAPGWYQLHIYAHSAFNGSWDDRPVNVQVVGDAASGGPWIVAIEPVETTAPAWMLRGGGRWVHERLARPRA